MGQPLITSRTVTLTAAGGASPTLRCWAAPEGEAFKNLSITVSSHGEVLAAGNLTWTVYYGGYWSGVPFASASTHAGGSTPAAGTGVIAGGTAVHSEVFSDTGPFLPNRIVSVPYGSGNIYKGLDGLPIVVELTNAKAVAITVYVTFQSESVQDWR